MSLSPRPIVVGVGELLWDCFPAERRPGGAPANVAFHARQLGCLGVVCSRVGDDDLGRELRAHLDHHDLPTEFVQTDAQHATSIVDVTVTAAGQPTYVIHEGVAWDYLALTPKWQDLFARAAAVCFGTLAQRSPVSRQTIQDCLAATRQALIVYDVNLRTGCRDPSLIEPSLHRANVAKFNLEEAETLATMFNLGTDRPLAAAQACCDRFGLQLVCVTRGEAGCLLVTTAEVVDEPGVSISSGDPVGAGDAFTAATIWALLNHWPLTRVARFANRFAGLVAGRRGAMPVLDQAIHDLRSELDTDTD